MHLVTLIIPLSRIWYKMYPKLYIPHYVGLSTIQLGTPFFRLIPTATFPATSSPLKSLTLTAPPSTLIFLPIRSPLLKYYQNTASLLAQPSRSYFRTPLVSLSHEFIIFLSKTSDQVASNQVLTLSLYLPSVNVANIASIPTLSLESLGLA